MRGFGKQKPPNAFSWFARYIADQRHDELRPFRSFKAAIHDAAIQWEKLSLEEKADWKEKARAERQRFLTDPELRSMTPREFIGQACEISASGMTGGPEFWSRHWTAKERDQYADELDMLENFDTKKREYDRELIQTSWAWMFSGNREALLRETFLFVSVQSSSPVEADNYVPETLAIVQFSLKDGISPYSEFCCSLAVEQEWQASRRSGMGHSEYTVEEDGCQARVGMQAVAKLVFQKVKPESLESGTVGIPVFFCMAEEFEVVYDALCELKIRASKWAGGARRLSVRSVGTMEDLTYCLMKLQNIPMPDFIGNSEEQQRQFYFDNMMERVDPNVVTVMRCHAHDGEMLTRCPLSVVRLVAYKIKEWIDAGGIPKQDSPLIERQPLCQRDWPTFSDGGQGEGEKEFEMSDDEEDSGDVGGKRYSNVDTQPKIPIGRHERTLAWIEEQGKMRTSNTTQQTETESQSAVLDRIGRMNIQCGGADVQEDQSTNEDTLVEEQVVLNGTVRVFQRGVRSDGDFTSAQYPNPQYPGVTSGQLLEELKIQSKLPHGCRGIGRGLHLVPSYAKAFEELLGILKK